MFVTWVQYTKSEAWNNTRRNQKSLVRNILSKQLVIRVPIVYHNLVVVARLASIALFCLSPVVSSLCFVCGLRQERVLLRLIHMVRLTCIVLICLSPIVSGLRFIYGLCSLREERVLLCLQARLR
jgi:hypothetical protein